MESLLLTIHELPTEYNTTRIGCAVVYSSGREFTSTTTLLLIQGIQFDCHADEELPIKEVSTLVCSPVTYRNVFKVSCIRSLIILGLLVAVGSPELTVEGPPSLL